jgi:vitamin B12 transporter
LLRRPPHKVSLTGTRNPIDRLTLSGTVIALSDYADTNRDGSIPFPHRARLCGHQSRDHVDLFARIDNLTNTQYQDPTGFMRPGLGVFGGMRLAIY